MADFPEDLFSRVWGESPPDPVDPIAEPMDPPLQSASGPDRHEPGENQAQLTEQLLNSLRRIDARLTKLEEVFRTMGGGNFRDSVVMIELVSARSANLASQLSQSLDASRLINHELNLLLSRAQETLELVESRLKLMNDLRADMT